MTRRWRRFELLLPRQFNDGNDVPAELLAKPVEELFEHFGAVSVDCQGIEGRWRNQGVVYRDLLSKIVVDVPDSPLHRRWMRKFKARSKKQLHQVELWMVTYRIEIE
jgi:hypothetical protein